MNSSGNLGVIFLDFDGVLHPVFSRKRRRYCRLHLLESWLAEHPGVDVVISSSRRRGRTLDELRRLFSPSLRHRVTSVVAHESWMKTVCFACLFPFSVFGWRERRAQNHMAGHYRVKRPWVALDDWSFLYTDKRRVISPRMRSGLCEADMAALDAWFEAISHGFPKNREYVVRREGPKVYNNPTPTLSR